MTDRGTYEGASRRDFWATLDQPLSGWACAVGWLGASALFVLLIRFLGGPSSIDTVESMYSTWSIAHGHFSCAFPAESALVRASFVQPVPSIAPMYPLVSASIAALARLGSQVPFPSAAALGAHCSNGPPAMFHWAIKTQVFDATYNIGYVGWLFLMAGTVAFLRAVGRGRCLWEPVTLFILACLPPVWGGIRGVFHPEDLLALGLSLGGLACALRRWWVWAGILLALAVLSQQFALLVAAPLFVVAPANRRLRFSMAGACTFGVVVVPLVAMTSIRAIRAFTLGSGHSNGEGGTVLHELHLHGWMLVGASRLLPIGASMVLAWWLARRLGDSVLEPVPLAGLIALSFSLRLVFEENLHHTYYYMALAVALILLDVVRGHIRGTLVAWIALVTFAYNVGFGSLFSGVHWEAGAQEHAPEIAILLGFTVVVLDLGRHRRRWYLVAWLVLMIGAFASWPFERESIRAPLPYLLLQLVLVPMGIWLAAGPLVGYMRGRARLVPVAGTAERLDPVE